MKTFVINLDRDKERFASVSNYLRQCDIQFERISAINGMELSGDDLRSYFNPVKAKRLSHLLSPGEIGCALSHIRLYQRIVSEKIPFSLILEDDVKINPELKGVMSEIEEMFNPNENIVIMVGPRAWKNSPEQSITLPLSEQKIVKTFSPYNTAAYIITFEAARRLANFLLPVVTVADDWGRYEMYGLVRMWSCEPQPVELAECSAVSGIEKCNIDRSAFGKAKRFFQRNFWGRIDAINAKLYRNRKKY